MAERTLNVSGMSCEHCRKAVGGALRQLDGVTSVSVDLEQGKVDVTYDESSVSIAQMKNAIEDQGYDVV